jgi:hypothetical protein
MCALAFAGSFMKEQMNFRPGEWKLLPVDRSGWSAWCRGVCKIVDEKALNM